MPMKCPSGLKANTIGRLRRRNEGERIASGAIKSHVCSWCLWRAKAEGRLVSWTAIRKMPLDIDGYATTSGASDVPWWNKSQCPEETKVKYWECLWILMGSYCFGCLWRALVEQKPLPEGNQGGILPRPPSGAFGCQGRIHAGTVKSNKREERSKDKRKQSLHEESSVGMPSWAELEGYWPVHPR